MGARLEYYKEDQIIVKQGKTNTRIHIIQEGHVVLYMNYGKEDEYVYAILGKDGIFGETSMFSGEPSEYTAVAYSDVKLTWFEKRNLNQFFIGYPAYAMGLMEKIMHNNVILKKNFEMTLQELAIATKQIESPENADETLQECEKREINREVNKGYFRSIDAEYDAIRISRMPNANRHGQN